MDSNDFLRNILIAGGIAAVVVVVIYLNRYRAKAEFIEVMTYKDAIGYLADNQSLDPRIVKGAMYRSPHPRGYVFSQVFLDSANNPVPRPNGEPYGRRLIVGRFDGELSANFGAKDVIIVE